MANGRRASRAGSATTRPVRGLTLAGKPVTPSKPGMVGVGNGVGVGGTAVGGMGVAVAGTAVGGSAVGVGNGVAVLGVSVLVAGVVGVGRGVGVETAVVPWHAIRMINSTIPIRAIAFCHKHILLITGYCCLPEEPRSFLGTRFLDLNACAVSNTLLTSAPSCHRQKRGNLAAAG